MSSGQQNHASAEGIKIKFPIDWRDAIDIERDGEDVAAWIARVVGRVLRRRGHKLTHRRTRGRPRKDKDKDKDG